MQKPTYQELQTRIQQDLNRYSADIPSATIHAWGGYIAALLEWDLISIDEHDKLNQMLPSTTNDPVVDILLGGASGSGKSAFVFNGNKNGFPAAVFSSKVRAEEWIEKYNLSGVLTEYPVDISVYDWRREQGYTGKPDQDVANFASAHLAHWHYE